MSAHYPVAVLGEWMQELDRLLHTILKGSFPFNFCRNRAVLVGFLLTSYVTALRNTNSNYFTAVQVTNWVTL